MPAKKPASKPTKTETDGDAHLGPDPSPADDRRFHHTFTVPPTTGGADGWPDDEAAEGMHNANKVAVHQFALQRGVHPTGDATFDGHDTRTDGSVDLHYSVPVRPAHEVDQPSTETVAPSQLIDRMGGDTTAKDA